MFGMLAEYLGSLIRAAREVGYLKLNKLPLSGTYDCRTFYRELI